AAPDRAGPDWAAAVGAGRLTAGSAATGAVSGPSAAVLRESCSVIVRQATLSGRARGPAPAVDPVSHVGRSAQPPAGPFVVLDPSAGDAVRDDPQPAVLLAGRPRARPARPGAIGQVRVVRRGDELGQPADQHAPAGAIGRVQLVDLERDVG